MGGPVGSEVGGGGVGATAGVASPVGNIMAVGGSGVGGPVGSEVGGVDVGAMSGVGSPVGNVVAVGECVGALVGEHVPLVCWQLHSLAPRTYAASPQGQSWKASPAMDVTESGILIDTRLVQSPKAPEAMDVTESGIPTVARLVQ